MAHILLDVSLNAPTKQFSALNNSVKKVGQTLAGIKPNKELTAQLKELSLFYKSLSSASEKLTRANNAQASADSKLAVAKAKVATEAKKQALAEAKVVTEAKKQITEGAKVRTELAKQNRIVSQQTIAEEKYAQGLQKTANKTRANTTATKESTVANERHSQSILSMAAGFLQWQLAATLVMQPIQKIREAMQSLNETLVETENRVIALQRVLPEGSASNNEISTSLYRLAQEYGQTFENASQIAENFAKAGFDWEEVLTATESALLAINVAELDASESSEGMIAIMKQFGLSADDLLKVVDQINKVADHFPVSSEKIYKALQRMGSSAANSNLDLNEAIGLVTALSEATGRGGENIGTALNSLINFTQKGEALEIFASLSEETAKAVEGFKLGTKDIIDVWEAVSVVINNADERQADILNNLVAEDDIKQLSEELKNELGDIYETEAEVYGQVGVFRRNYFIAALANMKTYREASQEALTAEGYSLQENEKYMETYTAKLNTLKSKWQEVANDEHGLLGFKKYLVELGVEILDIIQAAGGLKVALVPLTTALTLAFGKKIIASVGKLFNAIKNLPATISLATKATELSKIASEAKAAADEKAAIAAVLEGNAEATKAEKEAAATAATQAETIATKAQEAADKAAAAAAQIKALAIAAVTIAITAGITIYGKYRAEVEETARKSKEAADKSKELADRLMELYVNAETAKTNTAELTSAFKTQMEQAGKTATEIEELVGKYDNLNDAIVSATRSQYAMAAGNAKQAKYDAYKALKGKYAGIGGGVDEYSMLTYGKGFYSLTESEQIQLYEDILSGYDSAKLSALTDDSYQKTASTLKGYIESLEKVGFKDYYDSVQAYNEAIDAYENFDKRLKYALDMAEAEASDARRFFDKPQKFVKTKDGTPTKTDKDPIKEELDRLKSVVSLETARYNLMEHEEHSAKEHIEQIQKIQDALHNEAEYMREIGDHEEDILKLQSDWYTWEEKKTKIIEEEKKTYREILKTLQETSVKTIETEIERLKSARDITNETLSIEEKKQDVLKAELALMEAMEETNVRTYNAKTGQWEWTSNAKNVQTAKQNLASAKSAYSKARSDKAIDDMIASLEAKKQATSSKYTAAINGELSDAEVIAMMKSNSSKAGSSAFDAESLHNENVALAGSIGAFYDEKSGAYYKDGKRLYDHGGLLMGVGGIKATSRPEAVLNPELTQRLMSPSPTARFSEVVEGLGLLLGNGKSPIPGGVVRSNTMTDNRNQSDNRSYNINGVRIPSGAENMSIAELFRLMPIAGN